MLQPWTELLDAINAVIDFCSAARQPRTCRRRLSEVQAHLSGLTDVMPEAADELASDPHFNIEDVLRASSLTAVLRRSFLLLPRILPHNGSPNDTDGVAMLLGVLVHCLDALERFGKNSKEDADVELRVMVQIVALQPCDALAAAMAMRMGRDTQILAARAFAYLLMCAARSELCANAMLHSILDGPLLTSMCDIVSAALPVLLRDLPCEADDHGRMFDQLIMAGSVLGTLNDASIVSPRSARLAVWDCLAAHPGFGRLLLAAVKGNSQRWSQLVDVTASWLRSREASPAPRSGVEFAADGSGDGCPAWADIHLPVDSDCVASDNKHCHSGRSGNNSRQSRPGGGTVKGTDREASSCTGWGERGHHGPIVITHEHVEDAVRAASVFCRVGTPPARLAFLWPPGSRWDLCSPGCGAEQHETLTDSCDVIELMWRQMDSAERGHAFVSAATFVKRVLLCTLAAWSAAPKDDDGSNASEGVDAPACSSSRGSCGCVASGDAPRGAPAGQEAGTAIADESTALLALPLRALQLLVTCIEPGVVDMHYGLDGPRDMRVEGYLAPQEHWAGLSARALWVARSGVLGICESLLRKAAAARPSCDSVKVTLKLVKVSLRAALDVALQLPVHVEAQATLLSLSATVRKLIVRLTHRAGGGIDVSLLQVGLNPVVLLLTHGLGWLHDTSLQLCLAQLLLPTFRLVRAGLCVHQQRCDRYTSCTPPAAAANPPAAVHHLIVCLIHLILRLNEGGRADLTLAARGPSFLHDVVSVVPDNSTTFAQCVCWCFECWDVLSTETPAHTGWRDECQRLDLMRCVVNKVRYLAELQHMFCFPECVAVSSMTPRLASLLSGPPWGASGYSLAEVAQVMGEELDTRGVRPVAVATADSSRCLSPLGWDTCLRLAAADATLCGAGSAALCPPPLVGCWYRGCGNVSGPREAALQLRRCGGCQYARYCSEVCQRRAWVGGHRDVCKAWQQRPASLLWHQERQ